MDCGFQVYKVAGTVYDLYDNKWKPDDGHVIIILNHNNKDYVIDAGFASHLPYIQSLYRRSHLFSNGRISNSQTNDPKRYTHFRNEKRS